MAKKTSESNAVALRPIDYGVTKDVVRTQVQQYAGMQIMSIKDKDGYDAVRKAIADCRGLRLTIEAKRKELKSIALEYGRSVDEVAKELQSEIEPIEEALSAEKRKIDEEVERIRAEREAERQRKIGSRISALHSLGFTIEGTEYRFRTATISVDTVSTMPDPEWEKYLKATTEYVAAEEKEDNRRLNVIDKLVQAGAAIMGNSIVCLGVVKTFDEVFALTEEGVQAIAHDFKCMVSEYNGKMAELDRKKKELEEREAAIKAEEDAKRKAELDAERERLAAIRAKEESDKAIARYKEEQAAIAAAKAEKQRKAEEREARKIARMPDIDKMKLAVSKADEALVLDLKDQELAEAWGKVCRAAIAMIHLHIDTCNEA